MTESEKPDPDLLEIDTVALVRELPGGYLAQSLIEPDKVSFGGEASAIVEGGRRDAEVVRQSDLEKARQEAEAVLERARREIRLASDMAIKELYDTTAELSVQVAAGIIGKELSPDDHERLVRESLEQMRSVDQTKLN